MPTSSFDSVPSLIDAVSASPKINIPVLETGHFPKDNSGTATCFPGKKAVAFAFSINKQTKAIKIWPGILNQQRRNHYAIVEKQLNKSGLDYFVRMFYLEEAFCLHGNNYDALLMDWAGRQSLKEYIYSNIDQKEALHALAKKILHMHQALNSAGIAHGHLHAGNVYVDDRNELKLIGYDGVFLPGGTADASTGEQYPDFCHPSGNQQGLKADYFAALILYLGIKAIAYDGVMWDRYKLWLKEGFIFEAADFSNLKNAAAYKHLRKIQSAEINQLLDVMQLFCEEKDPASLFPFYNYIEKDLSTVACTVGFSKENAIQCTKTVTMATDISGTKENLPENSADSNAFASQVPEHIASGVVFYSAPSLHTDRSDVATNDGFLSGAASNEITRKAFVQLPKKISPGMAFSAENTTSSKLVRMPGTDSKNKMYANHANSTRQKKNLLAGTLILCLLIPVAGYFLGGLADKVTVTHFQVENQAQARQDKVAATTSPVQEPQKQANPPASKKNDTAITVAKDETVNVVAIQHQQVEKKPALTQTNSSLTSTVTAMIPQHAEKKTGITKKNLLSANETAGIEKNAGSKLLLKKSADAENQHSTSFRIGTPPVK